MIVITLATEKGPAMAIGTFAATLAVADGTFSTTFFVFRIFLIRTGPLFAGLV